MIRPAAFLTAAVLMAAPSHAQDHDARIDQIFSWATPNAPGCAVGVSQNGKAVVNRAYGLADVERGIALTPATVFDIGSVQKQFVAAAVVILAEDGRLSLSDEVRKHIPELPDYGHRVTLNHLLTHTSGIRDWTGLGNFSREPADALTMILRQRGLNFAPGEEFSYSNSGYVLLKEIVARTSGTSFAEFARARIFEPLGMRSTMYAPDIRSAENGAVAYEKEGAGWKQDMMLGEERGGGAVLSTASDLLLWSDALNSGRLGRTIGEKLQEPVKLNNGRELAYGRGLFLEEDPSGNFTWHSGSARAFKAMLARFPAHGVSLAILCNAGDSANGSAYASRIVDLFVPLVREERAAATVAAVEGLDPSARAGLFLDEESGEPLQLVVNNGTLRIANGPPLLPLAADRFRNPSGTLQFRSEDEFELRFVSPDAFELRSMEGKVSRYRRSRPYAPTPAELQAVSGRYESEELRAFFDVTPAGRGVSIRLNGAQSLEMLPADPDLFQRGAMTVRLRRDAGGKVVGLDYSNPLLRNVRFSRTGDAAARP